MIKCSIHSNYGHFTEKINLKRYEEIHNLDVSKPLLNRSIT